MSERLVVRCQAMAVMDMGDRARRPGGSPSPNSGLRTQRS